MNLVVVGHSSAHNNTYAKTFLCVDTLIKVLGKCVRKQNLQVLANRIYEKFTLIVLGMHLKLAELDRILKKSKRKQMNYDVNKWNRERQ